MHLRLCSGFGFIKEMIRLLAALAPAPALQHYFMIPKIINFTEAAGGPKKVNLTYFSNFCTKKHIPLSDFCPNSNTNAP
jgi:hypothetical protein